RSKSRVFGTRASKPRPRCPPRRQPSERATMIVETGHYALVLALALALVQSFVPVWGSRTRDSALMQIAPPVAIMQFVLVATAYLALTYAHVVSDFSLVNVVENSASAKPLIYKI